MRENNRYVIVNTERTRKRRKKRQLCLTIAVITVMLMAGVTVCATELSKKTVHITVDDSESGKEQAMETLETLQNAQRVQEAQVIPEEEDDVEENVERKPITKDGYDYSRPVPESEAVDNDYFDDAVFIGDSRTEGLILYTGLSNAISYTHKGLMVDTVFTKPVINMNGEKLSVMDALWQTDFSKVYIMLGINETGWPYNDVFIEKYGKVIDEIKTINPDALIYVQDILPVTDRVSQTHSYVKNKKINEFNVLIRKMAEEKKVYSIDAGSVVSDVSGCLPEEAAIDGIHLKKPYCEKWLEYLKTHTVTEE